MDTLRELCILGLLTFGYADYLIYSSMDQQQPPPLQQNELEPLLYQQGIHLNGHLAPSQFQQLEPSSQQLGVGPPSQQSGSARSPQQLEASQQLVTAVPEKCNSSQQPAQLQLQSSHPELGPSPQYLETQHQKLQSEQLQPKDPHDSKVYNEVMNMHESIPIPHLKYDKHETPVLSPYGHDGLANDYGDRKVVHGEFSYYVQILYDDIFICGAALIKSPVTTRQVVITATHCLVEAYKSKLSDHRRFTLRMGIVGRNEQGQARNVKQALVHPGYTLCGPSRRPVFHDIGMLIPDYEFEINANVSTIKLPVSPIPLRGDSITVKGFGKGREAGHNDLPTFMRTLEVPVRDLSECAQVFLNESGNHIITGAHFCAGNYLGGVDACQGNSGGPAMALDKGERYLAGVVSWGKGCGKAEYPGVYARVWSYIGWITSTLYDYEINGIVPRPPKYPQ